MADAQGNQQDPKAARAAAGATRDAVKTWHVFNRPDAAAAAAWLNSPPAQQAGEAFASGRPDGTVDAYAFF